MLRAFDKGFWGLGLSAALGLTGCLGDASIGEDEEDVVAERKIQILTLSDWHGQLDPLAIPNVGNVGGAAVLSAYFQKHRAEIPRTLTLTAGDSFGATPPLGNYFEDESVVLAMNAMGFSADGVGNHNFDRGVDHFGRMIDLAEFEYVSANLEGAEQNVRCEAQRTKGGRCIWPYRIFDLDGVRVAVVGVTNEDAPQLLPPGALGSIEVTGAAKAANAARKQAYKEGARVFIAMSHMGATGTDGSGNPTGPLMDWANELEGFHLILGDHTNREVNTTVHGVPVIENKSSGATYARIVLGVRGKKKVRVESVEILTPMADQVTPDAAVEELLAPYREKLAVAYDGTIAVSSGVFERGGGVERLKEVALGNLVADALRVRYGTVIGFTNGGGLRAPIPSSYLPKDKSLRRPAEGYAAGPPFDVVMGDVFAVLPFGNDSVTRTITGAELWAMMEHSVAELPNPSGRFGQVSGIRVVYDSSKPAGQRVESITLADGGAPVPNDASATYSLATADFINSGGDGYTMLADGAGTTRDKMAEVLLAHVKSLATLEPETDGRLTDKAAPPPSP
jgi:5'-nucleotidase